MNPVRMSPKARHKARRYALQALYQWQLAEHNISEIEKQFLDEHNMAKVDLDYFRELLSGVPENLQELDNALGLLLDRPIKDIDPIELAILRIGVYELIKRQDIPYKVVINEALELAKVFGATDSHKYVNGVLDRLAKQLRASSL